MNDVPRWDLTALYASVEAQSLEEALRQSEEAFAALAAACRTGGDAARCSYCFLLGLCSLVERNKILLTGHATTSLT